MTRETKNWIHFVAGMGLGGLMQVYLFGDPVTQGWVVGCGLVAVLVNENIL